MTAYCAYVPGWLPIPPLQKYTAAPGLKRCTSVPVASTTPAPSQPRMAGMRSGKYVPRARNLVSTGLPPAALSLTSTSCPQLTVGGGRTHNAKTTNNPNTDNTKANKNRHPKTHPHRSLAAQEVI